MQIKLLSLVGLLGLGLLTARSQDAADDSMQKPQKFERTITKTVRADYLLFTPKGYKAGGEKKWPLILFLHGAGERGSDLQKVAVHGPPKIVQTKPEFPFLVVSPQCPEGETWSGDVLNSLLDDVLAKHAVDTNRLYLTGLSMGGFGSWTLATQSPERWAAVAPICGGGDNLRLLLASGARKKALQSLPVWAFHGAKDNVVKLENSEKMIEAFKKLGNTEVELTVYPEAGHDSWTETYNNPKLYDWFLAHTRQPGN